MKTDWARGGDHIIRPPLGRCVGSSSYQPPLTQQVWINGGCYQSQTDEHQRFEYWPASVSPIQEQVFRQRGDTEKDENDKQEADDSHAPHHHASTHRLNHGNTFPYVQRPGIGLTRPARASVPAGMISHCASGDSPVPSHGSPGIHAV